jgi:hypothetical protein
MRPVTKLTRILAATLGMLVLASCSLAMLAGDVQAPSSDVTTRVLPYIRQNEFDFIGWTIDAAGVKLAQASAGDQDYLDSTARVHIVRGYFDIIRRLEKVEGDIASRYADPAVTDKLSATADLRAQAADLRAQAGQRQPLAESILQEQIATVFADQGLAVGGQTAPPVSFHFTLLPLALIVSPRSEIKQAANVQVNGDLPLEQQVALEDRVAHDMDVSTLVAGLGGIGTYPTMIARSSYFTWVVTVGAHEWTHNYLTLRPLGINYEASPELRTMNETTAEIVGGEVGSLVLQRYYPDLSPAPAPYPNALRRAQPAQPATGGPSFDFRAEMHATRVQADALLAQDKIGEAEAYMEQRRQLFWANGYQIRKLNQAYFAFYGAYAAEGGGGAEGGDPVGPAVLLLRRRSASLKDFVNTMAGFSRFDQLQHALGLR